MSEPSLVDRLDEAVDATIGGRDLVVSSELAPLVAIARALRDLPRRSFKVRLRQELQKEASMPTTTEPRAATMQTASPELRLKNAAAAIDFYKKAFGARELMRFEGHGRVAHAEIQIGNSIIMLGEEAPDYGYPGPETLGGSPLRMHLYVDDCDVWVDRAVAAGARIVMPVADQFYGDRSGQVADPFGFTWTIATRKLDMSIDEMHQRMAAMEREQGERRAPSYIREGFLTVTPYLVATDAPTLIQFAKDVFGAEETMRAIGSAGGIHAEVRIGDSMVMMGGGAPDLAWRGESRPTALHVYVEDVDAAYARALRAGGISIQPPADHEYGERGASVKDAFGNHWYIATAKGPRHVAEGLHSVNVYMHPLRAEPVISFLRRAFGAEDVQRYASPDGVVHHARVTIGTSVVEMGEAHGPYQPMPTMFYLYVPNVDAAHARAVQAGATSLTAPADQAYGVRTAAVTDPFGNSWYLATQLRTTA
jgi:PhnB protein